MSAVMRVDPTFKCEKCGGHTVFEGTKVCYMCRMGAGRINEDQVLSEFGSSKVKSVPATQKDIIASSRPGDRMPKFD